MQQKETRTGVSHDMNLVGGVLCIRLDWNLYLVWIPGFLVFPDVGRERERGHKLSHIIEPFQCIIHSV